jgi:thiol:disulfide interchange protein DsbD
MGAIFFTLSLAMFGVFTLQLPGWIRQRLDRASRQREGGSARSAAGLGVLSALLVGPCMTAPLAGTLIYIAQSGNVVEGALLLFSLGLGMGLPLILMGTVGAGYMPKPGVWMDRVKNGFGFALLATAVWTVPPAVPAQAALALWSALLLLLAISVWQMSAMASVRQRVVVMTVGLLAGAWSAALLVGALSGGTEPLRPLAQFAARGSDAAVGADRAHDAMTVMTSADLGMRLVDAGKAGRVAVVDFWADWCVECKVIDREVFGDSRVRAALEGVDVIRVDVSANTPDQRALMRTRQVLGPPTVLLVDGEGQEARAARLVGASNSETFLQRLDAVESSDD